MMGTSHPGIFLCSLINRKIQKGASEGKMKVQLKSLKQEYRQCGRKKRVARDRSDQQGRD